MEAGVDVGGLERVAREVAAEWGLALGPPFALARFSYVAPAGADAVLKVVPAAHWESDHEPDALAHWRGDGAARLLRHDRARRAFLVERVAPGTDVAALPEEEATATAVEVGLRLWRAAAAPFRRIGDELPRLLRHAPGELGARARRLAATLDFDPGRATLAHGDFHHQNILDAGSRHVAIDPQPFLAEPEFDVATFLWNPLPCRLRLEHLESRLAAFAAAGLDEERMRAWTVIRGAYLQPQDAEALLTLV